MGVRDLLGVMEIFSYLDLWWWLLDLYNCQNQLNYTLRMIASFCMYLNLKGVVRGQAQQDYITRNMAELSAQPRYSTGRSGWEGLRLHALP